MAEHECTCTNCGGRDHCKIKFEPSRKCCRFWKPELKPIWIPVEDALPEKAGNYLCTLYYAIPPYHLLHPENDTYIREVSIQFFDGKSFIASVIAWMPMPNAYDPSNNMIGD